MATRRRRTTQPLTSAPEVVEPTHEEMLEVAAEREAEQVVEEDEEKAIEVFMAMAAADTFEAMYKAEEESGSGSFFDPDAYKEEIRYPAKSTGTVPELPSPQLKRRPRYILRNNTRRRKG